MSCSMQKHYKLPKIGAFPSEVSCCYSSKYANFNFDISSWPNILKRAWQSTDGYFMTILSEALLRNNMKRQEQMSNTEMMKIAEDMR